MAKVETYRKLPTKAKLAEALHDERQNHGDTCVTLGMACQALGFDIAQSDKLLPAIKALVEAKEAAEKALVVIGEKAVVDFDDETVGQVDAVVKDREKYKDWLRTVYKTVEQHEAEKARLQAWVNDLQAGKYVNCVYCGHRYGPEKNTPVAMADVLKAHIRECPKHPMAALAKALSRLVETKRLKDASGKTPEYEAARKAAWDEAERVLAELGPKEPKTT